MYFIYLCASGGGGEGWALLVCLCLEHFYKNKSIIVTELDILYREIPTGQRGEVYEVEKGRVAVILDKGEKDDSTEQDAKPPIYWIQGTLILNPPLQYNCVVHCL